MPLKGDERALLQLVCERGQSYEDIAGLLGSDVAGVQAKARAALTELGGADPDAEVGLTDYILGQSDPIGRADAIRFLQQDHNYLVLAQRLELALLELAPGAKLPKLPESRGSRRRAAMPPAGEPLDAPSQVPVAADAPAQSAPAVPASGADAAPRTVRPPKPASQSRTIAIFVGAGIILLIVILAVAGVFSGSDSTGTPSASSTDSSTTANGDARKITSVPLSSTAGSGVAGTADFGLVSNQQLYVDLDLHGLDPKPAAGTTYLLWLMLGDSAGYPISSPLTPDANGNFSGRLAVPTAVAVSVGGQAKFVKVSASPINELRKRVKAAAAQKAPILAFTGTELANGKIPLAAPAGG